MARPTQQEIDEFNARMNEPDEDEDFEIEIFTPEGHGARLPYRKGRTYLSQHFGIDVGDAPTGDPNAQQQQTQPPAQTGKRGSRQQQQQQPANTGNAVPPEGEGDAFTNDRTSQRYFGRRS